MKHLLILLLGILLGGAGLMTIYLIAQEQKQPVICEEIKIKASYLVNNGGSPYWEVLLQEENGNQYSIDYWDSVPYVGEILTHCTR